MKTRDLRSAYFEMDAARVFAKSGFDILMQPEFGHLTSDFDFSAVRKNLRINVEVTALEEKEFYREDCNQCSKAETNAVAGRLSLRYFLHHTPAMGKPWF